MSEYTNTPTPITRVSRRKQGKRLTQKERKAAQALFLDAYSDCANIRESCVVAGIDRSTFYQWFEHDENFSILYHQAEKDANDLLISEAWRRAVRGVEEPVVSMGQVVYRFDPVVDENGSQVFNDKGKPAFKKGEALMSRKYSDNLLTMLIKAKIPEYRDKQQVDVTTHTGAKDMQSIHDAIAYALSSYPEAKVAVAEALVEIEKTRTSGK